MDPFESLLTSTPTSKVSPEVLEMLGRQASQLFQQRGIPLNQAVVQVVANHPELGNEHLKRIIEFANTVTFQEMFQNSEDKNVHFDVADPGVVLRDVSDGGTPMHSGKTLERSMSDYATTPSFQQGANETDQLLGQQFGAQDTAKLAFEVNHEYHSNPIEDVHDLKLKAEATRDTLVEAYERADIMMKSARAQFYTLVKTEVLDPDGAGLGGVLGALEKIASSEELWALMEPVIGKLKADGISDEVLHGSLKKTAGQQANIEHPLFANVSAMLKIAKDMSELELAIADTNQSLEDATQFLKKAGALATGIKNAVDIKGKVPSGLRQRFPR
jgi:hypothetical protein